MVKKVKTLAVKYVRDEVGWWVGSIPKIPGCHTQGRTIEQTRRRIREALGLFVGDPEAIVLRDEIHLPRKISSALTKYERMKVKTDLEFRRLSEATKVVLDCLTREMKISMRDAGELLGLSHQRVHQLMNAYRRASRKKQAVR